MAFGHYLRRQRPSAGRTALSLPLDDLRERPRDGRPFELVKNYKVTPPRHRRFGLVGPLRDGMLQITTGWSEKRFPV